MLYKLKYSIMKTKFYLMLAIGALFAMQFNVNAQLKSIQRVYPIVNVDDIVTTSENVMIAEDGVGQWWIGDSDPNSAVNGTAYVINKGNLAPWDDAYNNYAVEMVGHRKTDDQTNVNSFMLWSPTDSGVPWNYTNSTVKFDIKITDGEDWTYGNTSSYPLAIYFWVAIKHGWDDSPKPKWIQFHQGSMLEFLDDTYYKWSDYYPTGLGTDLADGNWHSLEVDLIKVIENAKQACIDNGTTDSNLGTDGSEGVKWNWYGVLGMEVYGLNVRVGNVEVVGSAATKINNNSLENKLNIYPNPSSGAVNIDMGSVNSYASVSIYSITGQLVETFNNVESHTNLNLSGLAQGSYFIKVNDGTKSITQKINITK